MSRATGRTLKTLGGGRSAALLLSVLLLWCSFARGMVLTPQGVQCPTASVQTVRIAKRDCCDRIVGYEIRAPKIGESGFKQCRCAEKKSTQHAANESGSFRVEVFCPTEYVADLHVPDRIAEVPAEDTYFAPLTVVPHPPSIRPPTCA